ncbi:hypothetical protein V6N13_102382 [Hibiscus sabdariffa]
MERGLGAWSLKLNLLRHWLLFNTWLCLALQSAFQLGFLPGACIRPGMFLSPYLSLWEDISIAMDVIFLGDIYILSWKVSLDVGKSNRRKCKWASGNEIGTKQSRSPSFVKYCWRNIRELLQPVKAEVNVRLRDPLYRCMGAISALRQQGQSLQAEINAAKAEIIRYMSRVANLIPLQTMALYRMKMFPVLWIISTFMDVNIALKVQLQSAELCMENPSLSSAFTH